MTSKEYKLKAKTAMATRAPNIIIAGAIYVIVWAAFNIFISRISMSGFTNENLERLIQYAKFGDVDKFLMLYANCMPAWWQNALRTAVNFLVSVVELGLVIFIFNKIRRTGETTYANLLDGFSVFLRYLGVYFLKTVIVAVGTALLVVPGIIAFYCYRMTEYIMLDHPEYNIIECMRESRLMMKGNKWRLFCLDFSFIGWRIVEVFAPYVARLWTAPYITTANVMFYESLAYPERYAEYPLMPVMPQRPRM